VIDCGIIPDLVKAIGSDTQEVKKEACWAISNATREGTREQIRSCPRPPGAVKRP
jgi:hypothetical protein